MLIKYEDLMKEYYPKDLLIDMFSQYYGENNGDYIKERIESVPVIFIAEDELSLRIKQIYKDRFESEGVRIFEELQNFAKGKYTKESISVMVENKDIIKQLGFDVDKIIEKHPLTRRYSIKSAEETKRLTNYINYSIPEVESINDKIDFQSIIDHYNRCIIDNKNYAYDVKIENGKVILESDKNTYKLMPRGETLLDNLTRQDEEFLMDLCFAENDIIHFKNNECKYVLKNINKIFNTDYSKVNEMVKDGKVKWFFDFIKEVREQMKPLLRSINVNKQNLIAPQLKNEDYLDSVSYFVSNKKNAAFYHPATGDDDKEYVAIRLPSKSKRIGSHEANHVISVNGKGVKNIGLYDGFNSEALNEIVNEFLNKRAIENYSNYLDDPVETGYDIGVKFMEKFLIAYEYKFKECYLAKDAKTSWGILTEFFDSNMYKLSEMAEKIKNINWGRVVYDVGADNIADWIKKYKTNPEILNNIPENYREEIIEFIEFDKFLDKLIENKQNFEKGEGIIIPREEYCFKDLDNNFTISE